MTSLWKSAIAALGVSLTALPAAAVTFSYTGSFSQDDEVFSVPFSLAGTSVVQVRTYGYNGGRLADGTLVAAGGFDPVIGIADSDGLLQAFNDDIPDYEDLLDDARDSYLTALLPGDDYTLHLTQFNNVPHPDDFIGEGFFRAGQGNFTAEFGCSQGFFCNLPGENRSGAFAFDLLIDEPPVNNTPAPVPLPATAPLLLLGLAGAGWLGRRRRG